ncbi:MAG: MarR family transcriptional regulator [Polyangiales bacterium]
MNPRLSYLIKWVERGIRSELDAALRPVGVSTPEYTTLSVLRSRSGLSSAQLARRAFVSGQAMNQLVIAIEKRGWIERSADPRHGKILRATLTLKGAEVLRACDKATAHVEKALLSQLTREQAANLREALNACADALSRASGHAHELEP